MNRYLTTAALAAIIAAPAMAQDFSDVRLPRNVRVIVPYNAGGSSDTLARLTIPEWEAAVEELSGQSFNTVVANLPGASGQVGWTTLASSPPNGSTISIFNLPAVPLIASTRESEFKDWLDKFTPLGMNVIDPNVVRLSSQSRFSSIKEAVQAAIDEPGSVTVGADGPISDDHAALYAVQLATGAEFSFVPFTGSAPANRAFLAGEIDMAIGNVFDYIQTEQGAAEAMILQAERYEAFIPDVPTAAELLGLGEIEVGSARGFAGPAGMPEDLAALYVAAFDKVYADAEFVEEMKEKSMTVVPSMTGADYLAYFQKQQTLTEELLPLFEQAGYTE